MLEKKVNINKNISIEKNKNFYLLRDNDDKIMLAINDFGKYILDFEGKRVKDIIEILQDKYDKIKSSKIEDDIIDFIEDCYLKKVIYLE